MFVNRSHAGYTLVELLISMAIGLFLVSGVIRVMLDTKETYLLSEEIAYIQESARFALDELSYDIRMAGYMGCNQGGALTNTINDNSWPFLARGIIGFEQGDVGVPAQFAADVAVGTDVLIVNRGDPNDRVTVESHTPPAATIHLTDTIDFKTGDVLVIASANCDNMAIFQRTGPNSSNTKQIVHNTGGSVSPGNCHKALSLPASESFGAYDCSSPPDPSDQGYEYPPGSTIMRFSSNAYFIKPSPATGLKSLFKQSLINSGGSATTVAREVTTGIEDLEVIYGVDNDATPDGVVDRYFSASGITDTEGNSGNSYVGWDRVISLRITMVLRSVRFAFPENTLVSLGDGDVYNDRYMRQKVSSTIRIRNRITSF